MAYYDAPYKKVLLTANGGINGVITVTDTTKFVESAQVYLSSSTQPIVALVVDRVASQTILYVKQPIGFMYSRFDCTAYTVADGATLTQPEACLNTAVNSQTTDQYSLQNIGVWQNGFNLGPVNSINFGVGTTVSVNNDIASVIVTAGAGTTYPKVDTYADLPITTTNPPLDAIYIVRNGTGTWLLNRKEKGLYIRTNSNGNLDDWSFLGEWQETFSDSNFQVYDNLDNTKLLMFDVGGLTSGSTSLLSVPNKNGTLALISDIPTTTASLTDSLNKRFATDAQLSLINTLSGANTGDVTLGTANGLSLVGQVLSMGVAGAASTGAINTTTQTIAGAKTLTGALTASGGITTTSITSTGTISATNITGTNTGDVTIGTSNGLSIVGQVISMGLAGAATIGAISASAQTIAGAKTFSAIPVFSAGAQTSTIFNTNGLVALDQVVTVGSNQLDASVSLLAKLLSIGTGIGGTYVEKLFFNKRGTMNYGTITDTSGTPGNAIINATKGRFSFPSAANTVVITCDQCTADSVVVMTPETFATGAWSVTPLAGSFTARTDANGLAIRIFRFYIIN